MENLRTIVDRVRVTVSIIFAKKPAIEEYKRPTQPPKLSHSIFPDEATRPDVNQWFKELHTFK